MAATALGKLGDERAAQPLLDLLETEDKSLVRLYAVKALGKIGVDQAAAVLHQIAQDKEEQKSTRIAAKTALQQGD